MSSHPANAAEAWADIAEGILGLVIKQFPNTEERPQQVEMTRSVATSIALKRNLVAQAPTGVGKSLAYLCGVLPFVLSKERLEQLVSRFCDGDPQIPLGYGAALAKADVRSVVVTSSLTLQDQLVGKDLPFLAEQDPSASFSYAVMKGRTNYLCHVALADTVRTQAEGVTQALLELDDEDAAPTDALDDEDLAAVVAWSGETTTGDRAELPFEPSPATWSTLSMSSEACPGATKCEFGGVCFAERARDLASEADVVVVNAHLYAINIATRGHVLPEHDVVVFDEAHDIEGIFSSMFGAEVRPTQLFALTRSIAGIIKDDRVTRGLERAGAGLLRAIEETSQPPRPGQPIGDVPLLEGTRGNQELTNALNAALLAVGSAQRALGNLPPEAVTKMRAKVHHARGAAAAFVTAVNECLSADESSVAWLENGNKIRTAPLDVGGVLDRWFWTEGRDTLARIHSGAPVPSDDYPDGDEEQDPVPPRSVVFTSATIPTRIGEQLHIPDPRLLRVGSPFDYRANSLLYVPQMPSPTKDPTAWRKAVTAQFAKLITAAGGRTLGLFTSTEAMHQNAKAIRDLVPFPILAQGDLPKRELLRLFSEDEQTSLFATRSFFQGVDVPGGSLSLVALDRIPFARPDDPLISARQEAAGGGQLGFQRVSVPLAATTLAQAAGRLIRSTRDQGVVAVMDPRLAEAGYRPQLLDPLPPMQRTRDETQVIAFLQKITLEGRKAA